MITPLRLFHDTVTNGAPAVVYTVPNNLRVVVRRLVVVGVVGANVTVQLNGKPVFYSEPVVANRRLEQVLETALAAGETISAGASAAGVVLLADGFSF